MQTSSWKTAIVGGAAVVLASTAAVVISQLPSSAEDTPPSIVEDYSYPGAAQVLAQRGIKLIKGDGHITLVDCGSRPNNPPEDLILVQSNDLTLPGGSNFCFKPTGASGLLTMEIPKVYFVRGDNTNTLAAKVEVKDDPTVVEVEEVTPLEWQPVGVGQERGDATILELRYPFTS
ncbi:hypothetical protein [Micromonospora parathelypteridis]|uniref:Secreted protein n=1 Tax=Micromonospora parathelypteridis TaxID=1839617 RepID=A0A840VHR6_9ACTN|nr:hypothetical protein [Micromonospora parathelypteridis]MBB5476297.1 hypothetical protein [Micromonospora parathelypteridis]